MRSTEILAKKRRGEELSLGELSDFLNSFLEGETPDYQMSAWLMAVCFQGMTERESQDWTQLMWRSGSSLPRIDRNDFWIDKHSTGGVGDKTSLLLVPLVLACGETGWGKGKVKLPMISGRGLGHTGGTLDKLESVPGFSCRKTLSEAKELLDQHGFFMIGQSDDIAPADRRIYALRDATATVESVPLIVSSILSKKLAEMLDGIVFDVKVGVGAFMKTQESARVLARALVDGAKLQGLNAVALLSQMEEPLGNSIGNAVEVLECWKFLNGEQEPKLKSLVVELGTWMLYLASDKKTSLLDCRKTLEASLSSVRARELFVEMFENQGGRWSDFFKFQEASSSSHQQILVTCPTTGYVTRCDSLVLGQWVKKMGGGRQRVIDTIDHQIGVSQLKKVGERVEKGEVLAVAIARKNEDTDKAKKEILSAFQVGPQEPIDTQIVMEVLQ